MFTGKTIILTGASEGIGRATARLLAVEGANLVLAARSGDKLQALAVELAGQPGERLVVPGDISNAADREALIAETAARFGRVDVLINNAGVGMNATVEKSADSDTRYLFEVNFFAPLHLTQLVLPMMRAQGGGQIIQVSSIIGARATPHSGIYCATKYALNGLSDTLRTELDSHHIQVTSIYPGLTATGFVANELRSVRTKPSSLAVPPERVARVIVDSIQKRSRARYITYSDFLLVNLARLLPNLAEWALATGFRRRRGL